ncbi:MAG TPA: non-canonical purine NTP pyrophosphatase [Candidatus Eremiobacteraceae bacterium]|nr:non-canonical purine NTP pyrophosphatase [Candidatus Eremiobacteraceae bacterium]
MPGFLDPAIAILIASRNEDKARELIELWGPVPPRLALPPPAYPDVPETAGTYEGNALLKARALADLCGGPALADDSGIEVEALDWGPGVLSARTPSPESTWAERNRYLIKAADAYESRRARYVCVCVLAIPGFEPVVARGQVEGLIADAPRGSNGFGYDPIFVYPSYDGNTFGEVTSAMKHAVSHRGRALRALRAALVPRSDR